MTAANPGSPEAVEAGCTCPVMDNAHGKGSGYRDENGLPRFYVNEHCPLHGTPTPDPRSARESE